VTAPLAFEESPETSRGRMLFEMLLAVHGHIRSDLIRVERLAQAAVGNWQGSCDAVRVARGA
jgi:hypothetical protein